MVKATISVSSVNGKEKENGPVVPVPLNDALHVVVDNVTVSPLICDDGIQRLIYYQYCLHLSIDHIGIRRLFLSVQ